MAAATLSVAIDTGGTFTDVTLVDRTTGQIWKAKTSSTPADPSLGFIEGIRKVLAAASLPADRVSHVFHGTTVATNAILEGRGAAAALITTAGFRHVLEIGRHDVPRTANMYHWIKPQRPIRPHRIFEVRERLDHQGTVIEPLAEEDVRDAAARIRAAGIRSVAICFLHAYASPIHEQRAAAVLREEMPDAFVSISAEVLPAFREYERTMATTLNAYVMPVISSYVAKLADRLDESRISGRLLLMKSSGGVIGAETARAQPIQTALSGPAGGVVGAAIVAKAAGFEDVITLDIGGTSADICLMNGARTATTSDSRIGDWPLQIPVLDITTIGAGGGSIARVGEGGLTVGPRSAGANPGPVCYGRGGTEPTVTDAHAVLGRLPPYLLGGELSLDVGAARAAIVEKVANPLGMDLEAAASGIIDIANGNMVGAIRVVSVERGYDPARFALLPFGGAGPLHGAFIGALLNMKAVLVPFAPGVLSSFGLLVSDLKSDFTRTCVQRGPDYDLERIAADFAELEGRATAWLRSEEVPEAGWTIRWMAALRYEHQGFELVVDWPGRVADAAGVAGTIGAFHREHERLYTFGQPDAPVELVQLRVQAIGALAKPALQRVAENADTNAARIGEQPVWVEGAWRRGAIYDRGALGAGAKITGPAIVTQLDATTFISPGQIGTVDSYGNIVIAREGASA